MSDQLFGLAGIATLGWVLLILLPGWRVTRRLADLEVFPIYLAILYLVGIVPLLAASGPGIIRDFGNADGVANLLARRDVALIAWIHILAFDQVVGVLIYRDNMRERYMPVIVQSLVLCLTFLFGPVGYLAYTVAGAISRRSRSTAANETGTAEPPSTTLPTASGPVTPTSALRMIAAAWSQERVLFAAGLLGLVVGALGLALTIVHGRMILPEGDLSKAASFDAAIGIFVLTLAVFVSVSPLTQRGRRVWSGIVVALSLISYAMESIQIARGIDPRFTHVGTVLDKLGGAFFLLIATGILVMFVILFAKILRNRASSIAPPVLLAIRYGCAATALGFGTGYLMSAVVGSRYGDAGNILPLHALGFHSLQALPLVALFFVWAGVEASHARFWIHIAGAAWIGACLAVAWQMLAGRPPLALSAANLTAAGLLAVWATAAGRGAYAWLAVSRLQTASLPTAPDAALAGH
jgi:hypothetical protein